MQNNALDAPSMANSINERRVWRKTLLGYDQVKSVKNLSKAKIREASYPILYSYTQGVGWITESSTIREIDDKYWQLAEFVISTRNPNADKDVII